MRNTILAGIVLVLAGCINQEELSEEYVVQNRMLAYWLRDLRGDDQTERMEAYQALMTIGPKDKEALPALMRAMNDEDPFVRMAVVEAIGHMGISAKRAEKAVGKMIDDKNKHVMAAAIRAYNSIIRAQLPAAPAPEAPPPQPPQ